MHHYVDENVILVEIFYIFEKIRFDYIPILNFKQIELVFAEIFEI